MTDQFTNLMLQLGIAAPLVMFMWMEVQRSQKAAENSAAERKELTTQFLLTLQTTITGNTTAQIKVTETIQDLVSAIREGNARSTDEHNRLIDAIGKFSSRS